MSDNFLRIKSISELHRMLGYEKPKHPLITILDYSRMKISKEHFDIKIVTDFYIISLKDPTPKSVIYGRKYYDFAEGTMMFVSPNQVFSVGGYDEVDQTSYSGWGLYFHPDLISGSSLFRKMQEFTFFSYAVNEALHISEDEKNILTQLVGTIEKECNTNIDSYSKNLIVTGIEQLLNYSQRFYGRQFITRAKSNVDIVTKFKTLLHEYFEKGLMAERGLPATEFFAQELSFSAGYLSDLLKKETGISTKDHIHIEILERAKDKLLNSDDTINEIAYSLGFEYPQYFNRLFKTKTGMTPTAFRELN